MTKAKHNLIARYKAFDVANLKALRRMLDDEKALRQFRGKDVRRLCRIVSACTSSRNEFGRLERQYRKMIDRVRKVFKFGVFAAPNGEVMVVVPSNHVFFTKVVK